MSIDELEKSLRDFGFEIERIPSDVNTSLNGGEMKIAELFEGSKNGKAGCIPYDHDGRMLFMISSDPSFGGPDPMIAKGHVDAGETYEQAGVREAEEELGLKRSNIVQGTLELGWKGELAGMTGSYPFEVYMCNIDDVVDFNEPHYETKEVVWMTLEDFSMKGRKSQLHIVKAIADKISQRMK